MTKEQKRKPNYLLILSIILFVGLLLWKSNSIWASGKLSFVTVRQGWVQHQKEVKTIFANTEILLTAPVEGKVVPVQDEGKRFRKGETVAKIIPSGVDREQTVGEVAVTAPVSGLFYSKTDQLEQVITPENFMNMDVNALLSQVQNGKIISSGNADSVNKLSPLGKIVNNLYPSWMFMYLEDKDQAAKGQTLKFTIRGEEYTGTVMQATGQPRGAVVRFNQYVNGTTENRVQNIIWNFKPASKGVLVPLTALCTFGEEKGVYAGNDGIVRFINVKVLDYNDSVACVEGIPEGIEIISNPSKGIEGMAIKKI
ncbi:MAG: hypothetical protein AWM53_00496 [Candidatus Dichloromethanomonas elyunquensis]|nr:MAG: hypothetical protein AWM53_00496 [Candidatus Dichloromethanomonas elyunquensis]